MIFAQAALEGDQACVADMRDSYRMRRDRVAPLLDRADMLLSRPRGAFYIMADTSGTGMDGYELAKRLIVEHGVALAPGETFGPSGRGMVRISLATALEDLDLPPETANVSVFQVDSLLVYPEGISVAVLLEVDVP